MVSTSLIAPMNISVPIVDSETGNPTPYFQQLLQKIAVSGALKVTNGVIGLGTGSVTTLEIADGTIVTIDVANNAITYAKMQNVSATKLLLGRNSALAGVVEEVTLSQLLDWVGTTARGDVLFRGATTWSRLPAGTAGQVLTTQGTAADPTWTTPSGGGALWYLANAPTVASMTLVSGDATNLTIVDDGNVGLTFDSGASVAGDKGRLAERTITSPSSNWTYTVRMEAIIPTSNYSGCGISIRDTVGGKYLFFGTNQSLFTGVDRFAALGGAFSATPIPAVGVRTNWYRAVFTAAGASLAFYFSADGKVWTLFGTETVAAYLTNNPNRVGFGVTLNRPTGINIVGSVGYLTLV